MRNLLVFFLSLSFVISLSAQPAGYYDAAAGLTGAPLKTALYNIIKGHTVISYDNLYNAYQVTDDKNNGGTLVWDMYSNCTFAFTAADQCGSYSNECDCYNREHSMPQSWFNSASPMVSDLFHVYPTDGKVNGMRGSYPFGEVSNPTYTSLNGSKRGSCSYPGYTGVVFEPINEFKGDFARTYFYMATRYQDQIASWKNNGSADEVLDGTSFPCYDSWFLNLLGKWHVQDPVSTKEIERNNDIYNTFQHNRNPFIDHPEYVYAIWGVGTPTLLPEPTNYSTNFSAHNIRLQWTDATGAVLPEGYLVRMSTIGFSSIAAPVDGTAVANSSTDQNIAFGTQSVWFTNLAPSTTYYFKLFGYTGTGTGIDYKTDASIPQVMQTTTP